MHLLDEDTENALSLFFREPVHLRGILWQKKYAKKKEKKTKMKRKWLKGPACINNSQSSPKPVRTNI